MENPDNKAWEFLSVNDIAHYAHMYPSGESTMLQTLALSTPVPLINLKIRLFPGVKLDH